MLWKLPLGFHPTLRYFLRDEIFIPYIIFLVHTYSSFTLVICQMFWCPIRGKPNTHKSQTDIYSPFSFIKVDPKIDLNNFSIYSGSRKRKSHYLPILTGPKTL